MPCCETTWDAVRSSIVDGSPQLFAVNDFDVACLRPLKIFFEKHGFVSINEVIGARECEIVLKRSLPEVVQVVRIFASRVFVRWRLGLSFDVECPKVREITRKFDFYSGAPDFSELSVGLNEICGWRFKQIVIRSYNDIQMFFSLMLNCAFRVLEEARNINGLAKVLNNEGGIAWYQGSLRRAIWRSRSLPACLVASRLSNNDDFEVCVKTINSVVDNIKPKHRVRKDKFKSDLADLVSYLRREVVPNYHSELHVFVTGFNISESFDSVYNNYIEAKKSMPCSPLLKIFGERVTEIIDVDAAVIGFRCAGEVSKRPLDKWFGFPHGDGNSCGAHVEGRFGYWGVLTLDLSKNMVDFNALILKIGSISSPMRLSMLYRDNERQFAFSPDGSVFSQSGEAVFPDYTGRVRVMLDLPRFEKNGVNGAEREAILWMSVDSLLAKESFVYCDCHDFPGNYVKFPVMARSFSHLKQYLYPTIGGAWPRHSLDVCMAFTCPVLYETCKKMALIDDGFSLIRYDGIVFRFGVRQLKGWVGLENEVSSMRDIHNLMPILIKESLGVMERVKDIYGLDWLLNGDDLGAFRKLIGAEEAQYFRHYKVVVAWLANNPKYREISAGLKAITVEMQKSEEQKLMSSARWDKIDLYLRENVLPYPPKI